MGIRFESEKATPFTRELLARVYDKKPLFIDGRWDIFFLGCPCGKDENPGKPEFRLRFREHRRHLLEKIYEVYGIYLEYDELLNGAGCLGGLSEHVERRYKTSESRRQKEEKENETSRVLGLQNAAHRLHRMGVLRILPSGDVSADRAGRIYREAERERGSPGL